MGVMDFCSGCALLCLPRLKDSEKGSRSKNVLAIQLLKNGKALASLCIFPCAILHPKGEELPRPGS